MALACKQCLILVIIIVKICVFKCVGGYLQLDYSANIESTSLEMISK